MLLAAFSHVMLSAGETYFTTDIAWTEGVDMSEGSLHYKDGIENNPWPKDVTASRKFRTLPEGKKAYNYRNKALSRPEPAHVARSPR